jgi:hypothetical protein
LALALALLALPLAGSARAAATFEEQSERIQLIYAHLLDLRPGAAPLPVTDGEIQLTLQVSHVPDVDARVGRKDEDIDILDVVPRVRARYVSAIGAFVGGSYTPPIPIKDFRTHQVAGEAGWRLGWELGAVTLTAGIRGTLSFGTVEGPVTESGADDDFQFFTAGGDLSVGVLLFDHFAPYAGGGFAFADTELEVEEDGVMLEGDGDTPYAFVGLDVVFDGWMLHVEQSFTDTYLRHIWVGVTIRL